AVLEHEITEGAMGRVGGLGDQNGVFSIEDLLRWSVNTQTGALQRDFTDGRNGLATFFSLDGVTKGLQWNNEFNGNTKVNGGDTGDFAVQDVFGTGNPGVSQTFSTTDLQVMAALGWNASPVGAALNDFNGDKKADILWQNSANG